MIRRIVDWILYLLHIKARDKRPAIEQLLDILPMLFTVGVVVCIVNSFPLPELNWCERILHRLRFMFRRWRTVAIGY